MYTVGNRFYDEIEREEIIEIVSMKSTMFDYVFQK